MLYLPYLILINLMVKLLARHVQSASQTLSIQPPDERLQTVSFILQLPEDLQLMILNQLSVRDVIQLVQTSQPHRLAWQDYLNLRALQPLPATSCAFSGLARLARDPARLHALMPTLWTLEQELLQKLFTDVDTVGETLLLVTIQYQNASLLDLLALVERFDNAMQARMLSHASDMGINALAMALSHVHPAIHELLSRYENFSTEDLFRVFCQTSTDGYRVLNYAVFQQSQALVKVLELMRRFDVTQLSALLLGQGLLAPLLAEFAKPDKRTQLSVLVTLLNQFTPALLFQLVEQVDADGFNALMYCAIKGNESLRLAMHVICHLPPHQQVKLLKQTHRLGQNIFMLGLYCSDQVLSDLMWVLSRMSVSDRYEVMLTKTTDVYPSYLIACLLERPRAFSMICRLLHDFDDVTFTSLLRVTNHAKQTILMLSLEVGYSYFVALLAHISQRPSWVKALLISEHDAYQRNVLYLAADQAEMYAHTLITQLKFMEIDYLFAILTNRLIMRESNLTSGEHPIPGNPLMRMIVKKHPVTEALIQFIRFLPQYYQFHILRQRDASGRHVLQLALHYYPLVIPALLNLIGSLPQDLRNAYFSSRQGQATRLLMDAMLYYPQCFPALFTIIKQLQPSVQAQLLLHTDPVKGEPAWIQIVSRYPTYLSDMIELNHQFSKTSRRRFAQGLFGLRRQQDSGNDSMTIQANPQADYALPR